MKKAYIASGLSSLVPSFALAADVTVQGGITTVAAAIGSILDIIVPVLVTIAVFIVIWGIFQFVLNAGDEEKRKEGRSKILWGVVGIFLMFSVWGLISILLNTFALNNTSTGVTVPSVQI